MRFETWLCLWPKGQFSSSSFSTDFLAKQKNNQHDRVNRKEHRANKTGQKRSATERAPLGRQTAATTTNHGNGSEQFSSPVNDGIEQ